MDDGGYYCWMGAEVFADTARTKVSNESLIGILQAFLLRIAQGKENARGWVYLGNLPADGRSESKEAGEVGHEEVGRGGNQAIQRLRKAEPGQGKPIEVARNLFHRFTPNLGTAERPRSR